jgi:rRNA maturation RNase YbeY
MRIAKRNFQVRPTISARALVGIASLVLRDVGATADSASFVFVDDGRMIESHSRYAGKEGPTDVLAFPAGDPDPSGEHDLGDVVICTDQAARQAGSQGFGFMEELQVLALHGFLHLLGYDHEHDNGEMLAIEAVLRPRVLSMWHRDRHHQINENYNPAR